MGVDAQGRIAFLEEVEGGTGAEEGRYDDDDEDDDEDKEKEEVEEVVRRLVEDWGWGGGREEEGWSRVRGEKGGWWFPGFVGTDLSFSFFLSACLEGG